MDKATEDRAVSLYLQGTKTKDITNATGVERPNLYAILQKRGIRPSRTGRQRADVDAADLLSRLNESEREVGRLAELLRQEQIIVKALMEPTLLGTVAVTRDQVLSALVEASHGPHRARAGGPQD